MRSVREDRRPCGRRRLPAQGVRQEGLRHTGHDTQLPLHQARVQGAYRDRLLLPDGQQDLRRRAEARAGRNHVLLHRQRAVLLRHGPLLRHVPGPGAFRLLLQGLSVRSSSYRLPSRHHPLPRLAGVAGSRLSEHGLPGRPVLPRHKDDHDDPQPSFPGHLERRSYQMGLWTARRVLPAGTSGQSVSGHLYPAAGVELLHAPWRSGLLRLHHHGQQHVFLGDPDAELR